MRRLALDIDIIALIRNLVDAKEPDPIQSVILAELGGVESIVCYLRDDLKTVNERDIALLKQIVRTHLNVRSNLTEENIRKLMRVKPDMLTFVSPGEMSAIEPDPLNLEMYESQIFNYNAELRTNNILTSALIEPDISQVKSAGKLEFDYVEISAHSLNRAVDMNEELDILDNIASLTLAANKLGLGVNLSGGIGYDNIKEIITIEYVEDIIIGKSILSKALAIGIEQAVRDMISML